MNLKSSLLKRAKNKSNATKLHISKEPLEEYENNEVFIYKELVRMLGDDKRLSDDMRIEVLINVLKKKHKIMNLSMLGDLAGQEAEKILSNFKCR